MIRIARIVENSRVDGPGLRTTLFVQGCSIHCPGCQNRNLWDPKGDGSEDAATLAQHIMRVYQNKNITISGGEPFDQNLSDMFVLIVWLRKYGAKHIILYTGYTLEQLSDRSVKDHEPRILDIIDELDVLVDGPFQAANDDDLLIYRGSRNQRALDVPASVLNKHNVYLNWDNPEIILTPEGTALMPQGLAPVFADLGAAEQTRRCGQQE